MSQPSRLEAGVEAAFAADGPIARAVGSTYSPRPNTQIAASRAVAKSIVAARPLLLSAGTGTGKTLAYLVPCALDAKESSEEHPRRTLVVTANNALLEQIRLKDGPIITKALGTRIAVIKGVDNYLCQERLRLNDGNYPLYMSDDQISACREVENWAVRTHTGDRAEIELDDPAVWRRYSTNSSGCTGRDCPQYQSCLVAKNRALAKGADIVVTNYAYLLSTIASGATKWLEGFIRIVCDEAHHLPDEARERLGWEVGSRGLKSAAYFAEPATKSELDRVLRSETTRWQGLIQGSRESAYRITRPDQISFDALVQVLTKAASESEDRLEVVKRPDIKRRISQAVQELGEAITHLSDVEGFTDPSMVYHLATDGREAVVKASLLNPGPVLRNLLWSRFRTPILCSATLSTGAGKGDRDPFDFIRRECGLRAEETDTYHVGSPFDYYGRTLLYTPKGGPTPDDRGYAKWCADRALEVIDTVSGPVLVLCTSLSAVREIGAQIQSVCDGVLVQGSDGRRDALIRSIRAGDARILVGSSSLGTGLDLPGLDAVIIDKIPFPQWGDPVMSALRDGMDKGAFFGGVYIPRAVMTWAQWFGRLMRRVNDRGIVATLDRRLAEKNYRTRFAAAKPKTRLFRDIESLRAAWAKVA